MKFFKVITVMFCFSVCAFASGKAHPTKTTAEATKKTYIDKINKINSYSQLFLASYSTKVYEWVNLRKIIEVRKAAGQDPDDIEYGREKEGDAYVPTTKKANAAKSVLLNDMPKVKRILIQYRSVTPVPKSFKNVDDNFTKFSMTDEAAMEELKYALDHNDYDTGNEANDDINKAFDYFSSAYKEFKRLSDPSVKGKKYTEG